MKTHNLFLTAIFLLNLLSCNAQNSSGVLTEKVSTEEQSLNQHPNDQQAWQELYVLLNDNYVQFSVAERSRLRSVLQKYGSWSSGTLYTAAEPGTKIIIKGHLINSKGKSLANAGLHIFQTDSHGYYTPLDSIEKKMGEPDARLFCFLKTDSAGNFEIKTVRPASYPVKYQGRTIPQHIHINITAPGYQNRNLQVVFDDDPAMDDYWRQWAVHSGYPILKLDNASPERSGTLEIVLTQ